MACSILDGGMGSPKLPPRRRSPETPAHANFDQLNEKIERQNLLIQTLLMLLIEKKLIEEQEFRDWVKYVDSLDGARDGKVREPGTPITCPSCRRQSPRTAVKCIYCDHPFEPDFLVRRAPEP
ncbi:MAG: hypothetical protein M1457_11965 [bacterium]|nr:hypothetical protein [bacterium]